ncbi:MAG: hypothetical protein WKF86_11725 [Acidimicrobiales bacterium]
MTAAWEPPGCWSDVPWEALDALDEVAVAELHRSVEYLHGGTPRSCAHPADPLWLCAMHPGFGVACHDCLRRHAARHSDAVERRCDSCGGQAERLVVLLVQLPRPRWLRPARAARVRNTAAVLLCGIGFCETCAAAAGCEAAA